ncbi:MAG: acyl carrier protein [Anaerolineales bacterium]|nr:acyl carrier protein [Anaerolineales bacterium]
MSIEEQIEQYITTELLVGKRKRIQAGESLISSGLLDSLTLFQLIAFVEQEFKLTVDDGEMTPENFQSIAAIKAFIERKRAA